MAGTATCAMEEALALNTNRSRTDRTRQCEVVGRPAGNLVPFSRPWCIGSMPDCLSPQ